MKQKLSTGTIWLRGVIATVIAAVLNVAVATASATVVGASPEFLALQPGPVITATVVTMLVGTGLFAILNRFLSRPRRVFAIVALGVAVLSLIAPVTLSMDTSGQFAGNSPAAALSLIPLHLIPAVTLVAALAWNPKGHRA